MFELMFTSFPVIIRYFYLKWRRITPTIWNMRGAFLLWAILAFLLFLVIFYFHPKSYSGILPFRTVSVVAQTSGPVTEVAVQNGQRVKDGDLLFRIEDSAQKVAVAQAEAELAQLSATELKAQDNLMVAEAQIAQVVANLELQEDELADARQLFERQVGTADAVSDLEAQVAVSEAELEAAKAQADLARVDLEETIPAQIKAAEVAVESAQVALDKTSVHTFTDGTVTQMVIGEGSPASTLILSPAMIIIPDRPEGRPLRITAGFSQVARSTLHIGMPAEIACDGNVNLSFANTVLPAHVVSFQPAVATGQVVPGGNLLEPGEWIERGSLLVYFELVHPEHEEIMLDGTGCIVQTYTNNIEGLTGHVIAATGIIKAVGLRLKVWGSLISGVGLAGGGEH